MNLPGDPSTNTAEGAWLLKLKRFIQSLVILQGPGIRVKRTPSGTQIEVLDSGGGSAYLPHRVKSHAANHLVCRTWDGTTEGSADVLIAKPTYMRFSITSETLAGTAIVYSAFDVSAQSRLATAGATTETQFIRRPYEVNDVIYAVPAKTFVTVASVELTLLDDNVDGRAWVVP